MTILRSSTNFTAATATATALPSAQPSPSPSPSPTQSSTESPIATPTLTQARPLLLASTSIYRRELMDRLAIKYQAKSPLVDEDQLKDENIGGIKLSQFLAFKKAESLLSPESVVIGADQLVQFEGQILGKPKSEERALAQLRSMAGKTHELITSFCVLDTKRIFEHTNITRLTMHSLSDTQILRYIRQDQPLDCAGAYKIEKQGIALFSRIETLDFTAIQGLPLMALTQALKEYGYEIP